MLLPLFQNIIRKIQSNGLTNQCIEDPEFAITMRMSPSLAFVPEHVVSDCFIILMADFSKKPTLERDCQTKPAEYLNSPLGCEICIIA